MDGKREVQAALAAQRKSVMYAGLSRRSRATADKILEREYDPASRIVLDGGMTADVALGIGVARSTAARHLRAIRVSGLWVYEPGKRRPGKEGDGQLKTPGTYRLPTWLESEIAVEIPVEIPGEIAVEIPHLKTRDQGRDALKSVSLPKCRQGKDAGEAPAPPIPLEDLLGIEPITDPAGRASTPAVLQDSTHVPGLCPTDVPF